MPHWKAESISLILDALKCADWTGEDSSKTFLTLTFSNKIKKAAPFFKNVKKEGRDVKGV